jgi:predicted porin
MRPTLLALAAAALAGTLANPAAAQSAPAAPSVQIFGIIDLAVRRVENNTSQSQLAPSGLSSSRLGFRGTEDLGGGLRAGFWLEGAIDADNGNAAGQNWQRRSTVSLSGGFGELRLGRDKNPTGLAWEVDPFGDTGIGASSRLQQPVLPAGGAYQSFSRSSNSVAYFSPGSTGFFAHASYAFDEGALGNEYRGIRLGWRNSAVLAAVAYGTTEVTPSVDAKMLNIGGSYDFKVARVFAMVNNTKVAPAEQRNILLGVSVPAGKWAWRASYQMYDGSGSIANREAKMLAFGGNYNLSRRTALYGTYARISNTNTAFTVATGSALTAGNDSSAYEFGIRHSF